MCHKKYSGFKTLKLHVTQKHPLDIETAMEKLNQTEEFMEINPIANEEKVENNINVTEKQKIQKQYKNDAHYVHVFPCNRCDNLKYDTVEELDEHMNAEHKNDCFKCDFCGHWYTSFSVLQGHLNKVHGKKIRYECNKCNYVAKTEFIANRHYETHHKECLKLGYMLSLEEPLIKRIYMDNLRKVQKCLKCLQYYTNLADLENHCKNKHPDEAETILNEVKRLNCDEEDSDSETVTETIVVKNEPIEADSSLNESTDIKTEPDDESESNENCNSNVTNCEQCNAPQNSTEEHMNHLKIIHKAKEVCNECFKCFQTPQSVKRHRVKVHGFIQRYKCDLCSYVCKSEFLVKLHHKGKHAGKALKYSQVKEKAQESEVQCDVCQKTFSDVWKCKSHKERVHDKQKRFECTICNQQFSWRKTIVRHNLNFHEGSEQHTIYIKNENRDSHKPYSCPVCNTGMSDVKTLSNHMKKFHPNNVKDFLPIRPILKPPVIKKYICPGCPKGFDSEKNYKRHLREDHIAKYYELFPNTGKFQCPVCNKGYKAVKSVTQHLEQKHPEKAYLINFDDKEDDDKEGKFDCRNCAKQFPRVSSLLKHLRDCINDDEIYVTDGNFEPETIIDEQDYDTDITGHDDVIIDEDEGGEEEEMDPFGTENDDQSFLYNDIAVDDFEDSNNEIPSSIVKVEIETNF